MPPPPVHRHITRARISPAAALRSIGNLETGAVVLFLGTVRGNEKGEVISHLEYEAYAEAAETALWEIEEEAVERFGLTGARIIHRIGKIEAGGVSVAIVACAPHRTEAYEASRFMIDTIKKRAPIWKKEVGHARRKSFARWKHAGAERKNKDG